MTRYRVRMSLCTITWVLDADSPEAAKEKAWARYEEGLTPDEIDCSGASVIARPLPATTLQELLALPKENE